MKKLICILIFSVLATPSHARGLAMSSGILDYSDDQKRSGFVEATYTFKNGNNENFFGKNYLYIKLIAHLKLYVLLS